MPVPTSINDLSTVAIENSPQGTEPAKGTIDDYFRSHASFIAELNQRTAGSDSFLQAGLGARSRSPQDKMRDVFSVKDFGAIGDGASHPLSQRYPTLALAQVDYPHASLLTDEIDWAAAQAAVNYAKAVGGGCIDFPRAHYVFNRRLAVNGYVGDAGIELRGNRSKLRMTANDVAILLNPAGVDSNDAASEYRQNSELHGFAIYGPGKANTASVGVQIQQGANVHVRDCHINGFYRGLHGYGALICSFARLLIQHCEYGTDLLPTVPTPEIGDYDPQFSPNDLHFYNCQWISNIKAIRALSFPAGAITFDGCEIEGNNLAGNTADGVRVVEFFNAGKVTMIGCHMEENPGQYNLYYHGNNAFCHLNVIGGEWTPGDSCGNCVYLSNANGVEAAANATIIGTRITNNVGNQLYISEGFKVVVIGPTFGGIQGDLGNLTTIQNGRVGVGGRESGFAKIKANGDAASNIAYDCDGLFRFVAADGARLGYMGNNGTSTYMLSDGLPLMLGTNEGTRLILGRTPNAVEADADATNTLGAPDRRWVKVYSQNLVLTPPASVSPASNGDMTFELTSNTSLKIKVRGSDGVIRAATLALA